MFARLRALAFLTLLTPSVALAQVTVPGSVAICADLALEVISTPKGRDQVTVTLRVTNDGPGDFVGKRGDAWVEHVVTIAGQEVERKKQGFTTIAAGGKKDFTFTRSKADGDFGVWSLIQFSTAFAAGQKGVNSDCNSANNSAVTSVLF